MKLRSVLATALVVGSVPLAGCEYNEPGTTAAYSECYSGLKAQGLEDNAVKTACISQNQTPIQTMLDRTVSLYMGGVQLYMTNKSNTVVMTAYRIDITTNNGKKVTKTVSGKFLQPGQVEPMYLGSGEFDGITPEDLYKDGKPTWTLDTWSTYGLNIKNGLKL